MLGNKSSNTGTSRQMGGKNYLEPYCKRKKPLELGNAGRGPPPAKKQLSTTKKPVERGGNMKKDKHIAERTVFALKKTN